MLNKLSSYYQYHFNFCEGGPWKEGRRRGREKKGKPRSSCLFSFTCPPITLLSSHFSVFATCQEGSEAQEWALSTPVVCGARRALPKARRLNSLPGFSTNQLCGCFSYLPCWFARPAVTQYHTLGLKEQKGIISLEARHHSSGS